MTPADESDALHLSVREMIDRFVANDCPRDDRFDDLALRIAAFQRARVPGFSNLCRARNVADPIGSIESIPGVPSDAFKLSSVFAFHESDATATFRTSGTTIGARGTHHMRTLATCDYAAVAFAKRALLRDRAIDRVISLAPAHHEAIDSSLSHMIERFIASFGEGRGGSFVQDGELRISDLERAIGEAKGAVLVCATSFALVHLLDAVDPLRGDRSREALRLPRGSIVMQTGGFKGRSREVESDKLASDVCSLFGLDDDALASEYGMTELSSQFYAGRDGVYREPPWARVVPVDPITLEPVANGAIGIAKIYDLANVDSAVAVLTHDRVRRTPSGFELLGRLPGATPRGCSIAIDELLGRSSAS